MTNTTRAKKVAAQRPAAGSKAAAVPSAVAAPVQAAGASANASMSSSIANTRAILISFEKFQKERLHFVQTVADHASREHNIEILQQAGVMQLLKPLLGDPVPAIQQAAAVALGR